MSRYILGRIGEEFGSHEIIFSGKDESISFKHRSFSRNSYAKGAIKACFWGHKKQKAFFLCKMFLAINCYFSYKN